MAIAKILRSFQCTQVATSLAYLLAWTTPIVVPGCNQPADDAAGGVPPPVVPRGGPLGGELILVPDDPIDTPPAVAVVPVFIIPSDQPEPTRLELAAHNFGVHLQIARRKYRTMLRRGELDRGTFTLASWDETAQEARAIGDDPTASVSPVVLHVDETAGDIADQYFVENYDFAASVLDAAGCEQASCPFVFAISVVGDPFFVGNVNKEGARKLNHGLNNGGGLAFFNYNAGPLGASEANTTVTFQSTLLHELGHAFGLEHISAYCPECDSEAYDQATSSSIMSYNEDNQIEGCGYANPDSEPCEYPGDSVVDALPGILMGEDVLRLSHNDRAFPELDWIAALDGFPLRGSALQNTRIAGHTTVSLIGPTDNRPSVLIGDKGEPMLPFFASFDGRRSWRRRNLNAFEWVTVEIQLPQAVTLREVDVYTGHSSGIGMTTGLRLRQDGATQAIFAGSVPFANRALELPAGTTGDTFSLDVRANGFGALTLRAVRLFVDDGGQPLEIFPASEPEVTQTSAGTLAGDLAAIIGARQQVPAYDTFFDATTSWHSTQVTPGTFVTMNVTFPEPVQLGAIKVHTGHDGQYHDAKSIVVERECACTSGAGGSGIFDDCGPTSASVCDDEGQLVFENVASAIASPDQLVWLPPTMARVWRLHLRTPNAGEQPVTPGHLVVRGLRFFAPNGAEIAPARVRAPGI